MLNATGLCKAFGDRLLIDNLSFRLPPGGIVGVIGPNGAGKSTLFRMITGDEAPDAGEFDLGETVKLGYVDQSRDALEDKQTVWQVISEGMEEIELGKRTIQSRAYVGQFNFKGGDQQKQVGQLSGGERNRVHLARMLKSGANLLLLDEPTASLDPEIGDFVRSFLEIYKKENKISILLASHNMNEVSRLCKSVLMMKNGIIIDEGTPSSLIEKHGRKNLEEVFLKLSKDKNEYN